MPKRSLKYLKEEKKKEFLKRTNIIFLTLNLFLNIYNNLINFFKKILRQVLTKLKK